MPQITFMLPDGERRTVEGRPGESLMDAAIRHNIPGIEAECGGGCTCATCHVYVDGEWSRALGIPSEEEEDMLDFVPSVKATSRLSCQILLADDHDGLVVHVPRRQL
jgi:2Fe-2S ferredoxin